ncbi:bifunctional prephenate dehydrogenase/3-phosphoshikimate 1-carboxyvinyltransferase [Amphritea sp. 2_MG-2023]|uniref:bifunctional prephenate dehydrogenase/3-phosphoshikimate 1-carboxyvinyltransferase n=1 Tax=Amphritea TaxID=515417 RepID=UPI001C06E801|nr:bifunctional prephenate dehydrogenase/3-phosphoshikimate 1-carboxyvinyltransferase [Amphritea sp. 2_MG-2023]MBU2965121.1 bifunctional prephenate dehydrogenase/3-phosphoshikimate 1-carboxyvinyltransferase [Amphritea atlantica]MDO6418906.1 bifunctional prephenate dehydrogenase/3-phosphoshikimate 1-carboxyvinyltransferase [Amphritea sp. 2_MG-2023]
MRCLTERVLVIGLGLIGGSLASALRSHGICRTVIGYDRDSDELATGLRLGVIDEAAEDLLAEAARADVIVLAVPVKAIESVLAELKPVLRPETILTDVGSVKGNVVKAAERLFGELPARFIPGHPIAGSEKSGIAAADATLFEHHKVILTPLPQSDREAVTLIARMWQAVGAEVLQMDVARHDEVLAATSHLPHLLAFSLVDTLAREQDCTEIFRYAAGGFRDFTRVAASDPIMWHDIGIANKTAILQKIDEFSAGVQRLRDAIETEESQAMLGIFTRAKAAREHFSKILSGSAYTQNMKIKDATFYAQPGGQVQGTIRVPGDKSISHRSIMLGSLADGTTEVTGFLEGEDSLATLQAFRDMGVVIEGPHQGAVKIYGVGINGLRQPPGPIYVGNSGTTIRLMSGLLAGQAFDSELSGDTSLSKRPMERVAKPLRLMGAQVETGENGCPPVKIKGGQALKGIRYEMPMASAQVKSCVMLAGLYAQGVTTVTEPAPTRDHTERMLRGFGYQVDVDGNQVSLAGGGSLKATKIDVPADISSATFFMVAAAICPDSDITLEHVGINPTRIGVVNILRAMGSNLELLNEREVGGEPVADIRIRYAPLKGIHIPQDQVPLAIDEFPALFIAAVCAEGETVLTGAEELRVKESDRIQAMVDGLKTLGADIEGTPDGAIIRGSEMGGGVIESHDDHRIAMSFAIASLRAKGVIEIHECANVATSFPNFVELAQQVGIKVRKEEK